MIIDWGEGPLSVEEYLELRHLAGLSAFSPEGARIGLANSLCIVTARQAGELVAMGRLVGDGGVFVQVVDIAVQPQHQRKGLGKALMTRLMNWSDKNLPRGCHLSLIADPGAEALYAKYGFRSRHGMARLSTGELD